MINQNDILLEIKGKFKYTSLWMFDKITDCLKTIIAESSVLIIILILKG